MGGDEWMCRLGPVAPEGANWMHFNKLVSLNAGTIPPSYCSPPSGREVLRFISHPFRISIGI